jgi:hypothetical protein
MRNLGNESLPQGEEGVSTVAPFHPSRRDRLGVMHGGLLETRTLLVGFGDVTSVDMVAVAGKTRGVIRPNGSGKTSFLDAVSGFGRCDGDILVGETAAPSWSDGPLNLETSAVQGARVDGSL